MGGEFRRRQLAFEKPLGRPRERIVAKRETTSTQWQRVQATLVDLRLLLRRSEISFVIANWQSAIAIGNALVTGLFEDPVRHCLQRGGVYRFLNRTVFGRETCRGSLEKVV